MDNSTMVSYKLLKRLWVAANKVVLQIDFCSSPCSSPPQYFQRTKSPYLRNLRPSRIQESMKCLPVSSSSPETAPSLEDASPLLARMTTSPTTGMQPLFAAKSPLQKKSPPWSTTSIFTFIINTEIYSTPKDGGKPTRTERFNYDMVHGAEGSSTFHQPVADKQDHKHSLDGVFSRALDATDKSKKRRDLKKIFKSLLGLLQNDLADEGNESHATITEEEDSCYDSTEYFSACDTPYSSNASSAAPFRPPIDKLSDKFKSHEEDPRLLWTETVQDFVNSVTVMSHRAAGIHGPDKRSDPTPTRTTPTPSSASEALSSLSAAQAPLSHPALVNLLQDAICEAVKQQFAALQTGNAASIQSRVQLILNEGNRSASDRTLPQGPTRNARGMHQMRIPDWRVSGVVESFVITAKSKRAFLEGVIPLDEGQLLKSAQWDNL
ncbi:hypothetical protein D9619_001201 [Psilocybe cf. subviscida]|uniref:Uncharacterized protein n=1 Tax=Psilocybe cf. subviscida TaxID=2480587 RepID=A0A8H5F1U2_9AGAR|nr:hypothetical protein D9619_001201 [Psilocybe cf. subviscida]